MTERWMVRLALAATLMLGSFLASAAEGGTKLLQAGNDLGDRASLQRGAQLLVRGVLPFARKGDGAVAGFIPCERGHGAQRGRRADEARVLAAKNNIHQLMQSLKLYRLDHQQYPSVEQGLEALVHKPTKGQVPLHWRAYIDKLPNDPWGRPYQYLNPGLHAEIDVFSLGADGQVGGEGWDADIGSWE